MLCQRLETATATGWAAASAAYHYQRVTTGVWYAAGITPPESRNSRISTFLVPRITGRGRPAIHAGRKGDKKGAVPSVMDALRAQNTLNAKIAPKKGFEKWGVEVIAQHAEACENAPENSLFDLRQDTERAKARGWHVDKSCMFSVWKISSKAIRVVVVHSTYLTVWGPWRLLWKELK